MAVESARCKHLDCFASDGAFASSPSEATCVEAANDACRGGTVAGIVPNADAQTACIASINSAATAGNCTAVRNPSTLADCSYLVAPGSDAGHD
jgi:hypothetical protein